MVVSAVVQETPLEAILMIILGVDLVVLTLDVEDLQLEASNVCALNVNNTVTEPMHVH